MKLYKIFFALLILVISSCSTTTKLLKSNIQPTDVSDLQYIQPFSYISLVQSGNKAKYNDSISNYSEEQLINAINKFGGQIPVTNSILISDSIVKKKLEKEVEYLCVTADRQRSIVNLKLSPVIDSLIENSGKRFGLITVATGFTRAKGNYADQLAKGIATGILTLGMYSQTPIKAYSNIYVMIVDSKENNITFFRRSFLKDKEPLDLDILIGQFRNVFKGYYWKK